MQHIPPPRLVRRTLVFLYARISEDPLNQRRGVQRQLEDLRVYAAEELNGEIAGEWTDNDLSAHSGVERPEYEACVAAAMEAAKNPAVKAVVAAYHPSRLWRRRPERAQAIDDFWKGKVDAAFEAAGYFNLQKAAQRSQLAQVGESDTVESEVKSERVARDALQRAQEGRSNGAVAYGWRRVYEHDEQGKVIGFHDELHPHQAAIVEGVIDALLSGKSESSLRDAFNDKGEPSPGAGRKLKKRALGQNEDGSLWNKTSIKKLALRPANAGVRVHKGIEYPAAWPAIVSMEKHAQIKQLYAKNAEATAPGSGSPAVGTSQGHRKHLLSWSEFATCGVCGSHISVRPRGNRKRGKLQPTYICDARSACVGRNEAALDEHVRKAAVALLSQPNAVDIFRGDDSAALAALELAEGLKARQEAAADDYADGAITRDQLVRITARLGQQITEARAEARRLQPAFDLRDFEGLVGPKAADGWERLDVSQRNRVLQALGLRLRILRATKSGPGFDPASVEMTWGVRGGPEPVGTPVLSVVDSAGS